MVSVWNDECRRFGPISIGPSPFGSVVTGSRPRSAQSDFPRYYPRMEVGGGKLERHVNSNFSPPISNLHWLGSTVISRIVGLESLREHPDVLRCQTWPSLWTLGPDQPVHVFPFITEGTDYIFIPTCQVGSTAYCGARCSLLACTTSAFGLSRYGVLRRFCTACLK